MNLLRVKRSGTGSAVVSLCQPVMKTKQHYLMMSSLDRSTIRLSHNIKFETPVRDTGVRSAAADAQSEVVEDCC